jgi:hypothetical protein
LEKQWYADADCLETAALEAEEMGNWPIIRSYTKAKKVEDRDVEVMVGHASNAVIGRW